MKSLPASDGIEPQMRTCMGYHCYQLGVNRPRSVATLRSRRAVRLLRKEVIQPHLPIRLPCYDFTPIINRTLGASLLTVRPATSGTIDFRGVTGGVYKARERIHRAVLMRDY